MSYLHVDICFILSHWNILCLVHFAKDWFEYGEVNVFLSYKCLDHAYVLTLNINNDNNNNIRYQSAPQNIIYMINRSICLAVVFNISRTNELQIGIYCYVAQVAAHTTTRLTKVTITPPCGRMTRTTSDIRGRWSNRSWLRLDPRHLQLTVFEARPVPPVRRNTRRHLPDTERPAESSVSVSQYTSSCGRGTAGAAGVVSRRDAS